MSLRYHLATLILITQGIALIAGIGFAAQDKQDTYQQPPISDNRTLVLGKPVISGTKIPRYGMAEVTFPLQATYNNAFDPDEIDVSAAVTTPKGKTLEQPAFYYQEYTRSLETIVEVLKRSGDPQWKVRFTPTEVGRYRLVVHAKDKTGAIAASEPIEFTCAKSDLHGFVRISKNDKRYFAFDDGTPYIPTGANICWGSGNKATYDYDTWLPKYEEAGCNYFRLWLAPGWVNFGLETNGTPSDRYGAGKINLANAWRLDYILNQANQRGSYVMMCLESFNTLRKKEDASYPYWEESPLNQANGGPLINPIDYWTNPEMLRIYRNKLRYLAARYGWSPNVLSWEFWNEVDIVSPSAFNAGLVTKWHAQMGDYIQSIDNWHHLRTTSFAQWPGIDDILSLPQIDYTQTHDYGFHDISTVFADQQKQREKYGKPHYIGEFGADAAGSDPAVDPQGLAFHAGIWSSIVTGGSGPAMYWWWDNHIEPHNLYTHLAALNKFIKGVRFDREDFRHIGRTSIEYKKEPKQPLYHDLAIQGPVSWNASTANKPTTLTITGNGIAANVQNVSGILHGLTNHSNEHNPLSIDMDLPHASQIHVGVHGVSGYGGAHLIVSLDGQTVIDKDMPNPDPQNVDTMHQYDGIYVVDVPAGKHTVVVENTGTDWMFVDYVIDKAILQTSPMLRAYGLQGKTTSLIWIENSGYTWYIVDIMKQPAEEQKDCILLIPDWRDGKYIVQFWDTYTGKETRRFPINVSDGTLAIDLPPIAKDMALRVVSVEK